MALNLGHTNYIPNIRLFTIDLYKSCRPVTVVIALWCSSCVQALQELNSDPPAIPVVIGGKEIQSSPKKMGIQDVRGRLCVASGRHGK